ncbi:MAG: hypothetical protein GTO18_16660 [Anaerolineales bacterium]|nr:hypothetical protein [Anaerolineales bacterium]
METELKQYEILKDDLSVLRAGGPVFVTFGEVMIRDTPADHERPERTRKVLLSMAGSEYTLAIGMSRLGIPSAYITRVPDNVYGHAVRNIALEQGVNPDFIVWAPKTEPIGRLIYEIGRTPRRNVGVYQRMFSAASKLDEGMVDWESALSEAKLFHTSGITFGLASHSGYERNYCYHTFKDAINAKPNECLVGMDFNYRGSLWTPELAREVMTPIMVEHIDLLITTIEDMAKIYDIPCGQYSAKQIVDGDIGLLEDDDIRSFALKLMEEFKVKVAAITIRYPDSFEVHRWESAAMDSEGNFIRSPEVKSITLMDRLGGGDTWNAGFYYGLLTKGINQEGLTKGLLVGDAFTRLKQTLMFDLPIVSKGEIQALMKADILGGGKRTAR